MIKYFSKMARLVKIEHSIFALPFAYMGFVLAGHGFAGWAPFLFLTIAMVAIRSFAMGVNRVVDVKFDRENPRTQMRELVTGEVTAKEVRIFLVVCAVVFIAACAGLNTLCLTLSPFVLIWAGLYSYMKRFTWMCHFFLGSVLGMAPVAGYLAVTPEFTLAPVLMGLGVMFWVAGFDLLYACQDADFDRNIGLCSCPACYGVGSALLLARASHANASIFFGLAGWAAGFGWIYFLAWALVAAVLHWEHQMLSEKDLSRINVAFFTLNGVIAILLFVGVVCDVLWG